MYLQKVVCKRGMVAALVMLMQNDDVLQTRIAGLVDGLTKAGPLQVK